MLAPSPYVDFTHSFPVDANLSDLYDVQAKYKRDPIDRHRRTRESVIQHPRTYTDGAVTVHPNQRQNVAVIIPTYNGAAFLEEAIRSVKRQSFPVREILVVDDASTDNSAEIAENLGCRCIRMPKNHGVAAARNIGITLATSEFVAFLDQDDRWRPNKVFEQVDYMSDHPELQFTLTHLTHFLDCDEIPTWAREDWFQHPAPGFTPSTLIARKSAFLQLGLFRTDGVSSSDTNWIVRAKHLELPFELLPQALVERRIHNGNVSRAPDLRRKLIIDMARSVPMHRAKSA